MPPAAGIRLEVKLPALLVAAVQPEVGATVFCVASCTFTASATALTVPVILSPAPAAPVAGALTVIDAVTTETALDTANTAGAASCSAQT